MSMSFPRLCSCLCASAILLLGPGARGATAYTIDQQHQPEISGEWSVRLLGPVGQEFVPQSSSLDVVELWISLGTTGTEVPTELLVRIREATIDGPILGSSDPVIVFDGHFAPVRFEFPAAVPLVAGSTHVIEVVVAVAPGVGNALVGGAESPNYGGGRAILVGVAREAIDLWFVTGSRDGVASESRSWTAVKQLYH